MVEFAVKDGLGCDMSHFTAAELQGKIMPDEHVHEHATCFNVKDRGLIVTIMGGFHLGPAPADYLNQVVAELRKLEPDAVVPMHCSGANFTQAVREQMPDKLVLATIGSRIIFGA
jgi:7,8-dihydropterin-6-yl-methyl-4-(beta-D-ribofuranosyl)aminobenzene 5'-phosphate synthase